MSVTLGRVFYAQRSKKRLIKPRGYVACRGALSEAFMDGALATHLPWSGLQAA